MTVKIGTGILLNNLIFQTENDLHLWPFNDFKSFYFQGLEAMSNENSLHVRAYRYAIPFSILLNFSRKCSIDVLLL